MSEILWQPSAERISKTRMEVFRRFINHRHDLEIADYPALHQWSIDRREDFWQAIVDFFDIEFHTPPARYWWKAHRCPAPTGFPGPR